MCCISGFARAPDRWGPCVHHYMHREGAAQEEEAEVQPVGTTVQLHWLHQSGKPETHCYSHNALLHYYNAKYNHNRRLVVIDYRNWIYGEKTFTLIIYAASQPFQSANINALIKDQEMGPWLIL